MKMAQGECLLCAVAMPEGLMFTLHYPVVPRGSLFFHVIVRCGDSQSPLLQMQRWRKSA
jgi:hypothetical protein